MTLGLFHPLGMGAGWNYPGGLQTKDLSLMMIDLWLPAHEAGSNVESICSPSHLYFVHYVVPFSQHRSYRPGTVAGSVITSIVDTQPHMPTSF